MCENTTTISSFGDTTTSLIIVSELMLLLRQSINNFKQGVPATIFKLKITVLQGHDFIPHPVSNNRFEIVILNSEFMEPRQLIEFSNLCP